MRHLRLLWLKLYWLAVFYVVKHLLVDEQQRNPSECVKFRNGSKESSIDNQDLITSAMNRGYDLGTTHPTQSGPLDGFIKGENGAEQQRMLSQPLQLLGKIQTAQKVAGLLGSGAVANISKVLINTYLTHSSAISQSAKPQSSAESEFAISLLPDQYRKVLETGMSWMDMAVSSGLVREDALLVLEKDPTPVVNYILKSIFSKAK